MTRIRLLLRRLALRPITLAHHLLGAPTPPQRGQVRGDIFTEQLEGHFHWTATVSGPKGLFDVNREARLVQPGDSYKASVSITDVTHRSNTTRTGTPP